MKRAGSLAWKKLIIVIVIGALAFAGYRYLYPSTPADIFIVSEPLEYGDTTITGVIQKDAPAGESGNYYLSLTDGQVIMLDAQGIEAMIGVSVSVSGYLTPRESESSLPFMTVSSLSSL